MAKSKSLTNDLNKSVNECSTLKPDEYGQIVHNLTTELFRFAKGVVPNNTKYGRTNQRKGISGFEHQIDVSIEGVQDEFLIECKYWSDKVDVPRFLTFLARFLDIKPTENHRIIHPMVITTVGFDEGIKTLAEYYGIETQVVKSAHEFAVICNKLGAGIVSQNESITISESIILEGKDEHGNIVDLSSIK